MSPNRLVMELIKMTGSDLEEYKRKYEHSINPEGA